MPTNYNRNTETVDFTITTDGSGVYANSLDYFVYSLAVLNNAAGAVQLYFNRYSDDYVTIPAGSYKEIAVTTNYYRVEVAGTGEEVTVTVVRSQQVDEFLTPLFPNLYEQADVDGVAGDEDIKVNPINTYGYTYTPWFASDGSMHLGDQADLAANPSMADDTSLIEIDYYMDGQVVSRTGTANFYQDMYAMMMSTIESFYPADYVPPTNPEYSPVQGAEVVEKVKNYIQNFDNFIDDEFFAGYASLTDYDDALKLTTFSLADAGTDKVATAWTVLGFTADPGAAVATLQYKESVGDDWTVVNLLANTPQTITAKAKYFEVTAGAVDLSFTGNYVRMIDFAPILNIVYPLGMTDGEGVPAENYASFTQKIDDFKQNLQASNFTGRVVYFRAMPFEAQASVVRNADNMLPTDLIKDFKYVFNAIRDHVPNYYQYSKTEEDLLAAIKRENYAHYFPAGEPVDLPTTLEEVIADPDVTIRGLATEQEKKDFIIKLLIEEYTGSYGLGGFSLHTFGVTYNRQD